MLEVTGIEKRYRGRTILKNVSFRANPRECIGIVGGNGCGKTTLLSILAGIRKPDRGSIRIDGQEALGRHRLLEEKIAYVPQENPLIPELTAFDNYRLWFRGKRREMERDLECGVGHVLGVDRFLKTQAGRLSGGEKKRLSIAAALSGRADILILDEPGAALDLEAKEQILWGLRQADLVKISDEEVQFLWGCSPEQGAERVLALGAKLVMVTLGPKGCFLKNAQAEYRCGCPQVRTVDTTGAGDIFGKIGRGRRCHYRSL